VTAYVVDASIAVKWMLPEEHTAAALRLQGVTTDLSSPDLIVVEVANVLWKKVRRGEIAEEKGREVLGIFQMSPLRLVSADLLLEGAWEIAARFDRSMYDSLYLALAVSEDCRMVTADRKLLNATRGTPLAEHVLWVEDIAISESRD
jgi:predicted nucleic acid-binding protein